MKMHPYRIDFYKPILAALLPIVLIYVVRITSFVPIDNPLVLGLCGCIVVLVYGCLLVILGLEQEDRLVLQQLKVKFTNTSVESNP